LNLEALEVYRFIDDNLGRAVRLFNLGHVFKNVPALRDLDKSEAYYAEAYRAYPEHDLVNRNQCLGQLAAVELQRLEDELNGERREEVLPEYLDRAVGQYEMVLSRTSSSDIGGLAQGHNQLGVACQYLEAAAEQSFEHFRLAIRYFDEANESFESAFFRNNAAQVLDRLGRTEEALAYASEGLEIMERVQPSANLTTHMRDLVIRLRAKL
jgi:tetratricopeptide (TPR) repeat protein